MPRFLNFAQVLFLLVIKFVLLEILRRGDLEDNNIVF